MILQALKDYYDRKAADPDSGIAPIGWELKEIPFVIVLDAQGNLVQIEDTREGMGKERRAKQFLVPEGVKKTSGIAANLLWDVAGYVFGISYLDKLDESKKAKALERAPKQKKAFYQRIFNELPQNKKTQAILSFLNNISIDRLRQEPTWAEIYEKNPVLSFRFEDENILFCQSESVVSALRKENATESAPGLCMVTGEEDKVATLHTVIKGVWGAQSSGANIVSFNLDPFRSFNKQQGNNAPVGKRAMFAYTTALNTLLAKGSAQRMQVGDASTVFWSAKATHFENDFSSFFKEPEKDDPDSHTSSIRNLFDSVNTGAYLEDIGTERFYVIGLAPNAARIAVRFWQTGTVSEFAARIRQHFEDLRISKPEREQEFYSLWRLLVNIAVQDKSENIPPNIAGDFMRSILNGTPYPASLLQAAIRRIKSDTVNRVKPVRAALLKAYLNRYYRFHPNNNEKEIQMSLDIEQGSIGYQLGRLFSVLEKIQEEANPGLNTTIKERYYSSACSSPVTVFPTLMRLKNHHMAKMEHKGRVTNMERLIGEIVGRFYDFPPHLNLHEQGKFAIGYYHQRQDFFTKKEQ
ncbi:type I-C CRISPR-associated protein Cas8c/Csd1 [Marispirochaeta aestuarii]|uniref:Type I-C CRISPR-associated protein Cas8c/Csd1 n=1 Tax=Marispirochaeta aestuarii TaxID=1963862 RepID=A0A1Y1RUX9_9SPIO|nr:type I-C CRISPR-associated protein Cas8c/Csd1 [Marispirochaeta aestuarii]ORC32840.1 type I-C CRISPR-associated protein Cas8c/Csd1 [Marispirochaeta aestuarii]